ncbi:MAG: hypothetical protein CMM48_10520 [Rhodospirillaceae bacterium]|nr:hypothetical protein [Rhodospirillaceae bacterium]
MHKPTAILYGLVLLAFTILPAEVVSNEARRELHGAVQTIYQEGVPHTDRMGRLMFRYQNGKSFFPIALYHSLTGRHKGHDYSFQQIASAGFNTIHPWEGQRLEAIIADARANRLQVIFHHPTNSEVKRFANDPNILAWYLEEEPTGLFPKEAIYDKLAAFNKRVAEIRSVDRIHPIFPLDRPILKGREADWKVWASIGDVSSHFHYPITGKKTASLATPKDFPASISRAVELNAQKRPLWMVLQAFTKPTERWTMPSPAQLRAMTYASLIHGATGIIFFAFDSFVTRDGAVVGMAPNPINRHRALTKRPPLEATNAQLTKSRALWSETKKINGEMKKLTPLILLPTSKRKLRVFISGKSVSEVPVRVIIKESENQIYVIAANLDETALEAEFQLAKSPKSVSVEFTYSAKPKTTAKGWSEKLEGFATRVYRVTP